MSVKHKARKPSARTRTRTCYHATLTKAINRHLPCGLFDGSIHATSGKLRWCDRYLTLCVILMAWGVSAALADRFDEARACLTRMFPGRRRPGKTYRGMIAAMGRASDRLLAKVSEHLRGEVRAVAQTRWQVRSFVPIGVDGSKVECPMTAANEQAFGCAGKRNSTPQQFVTTLLHLPTGIVWEFCCGPARASERQHLREMLPTLPAQALLIADAGFTGYELMEAMMSGGKDFLIRVGSNVRLLTKLGYAIEQQPDQTVYLWPDDRRKTHPPLVLRRIVLIDGRRNRRMHLLSSVLHEPRLSDELACEFYTMRWGIELYYRTLKQTMRRRKLCGDSPATARIELRWTMIGLWLLCLMGAGAMIRSGGGGGGKDPRRLSAASMLRIVRDAMQNPSKRLGRAGVERALAGACIDDTCRRTSSKKARHWPHRKKPKPIGEPEARSATKEEVEHAQRYKQLHAAA